MSDSLPPPSAAVPEPSSDPDDADQESDLVALVSVGEDSYEQVRLMNGVDHVPTSLRTLRENAFELVGSLFMPRGCQVDVDFRSDSAFGSEDDMAPTVIQVIGVVRKAVMIDGQPTYALTVHVPAEHRDALARLRGLLED